MEQIAAGSLLVVIAAVCHRVARKSRNKGKQGTLIMRNTSMTKQEPKKCKKKH